MKLPSFVKQAFMAAVRVLTSKEGIKSVLGISLYRNTFYLVLNSGALTGTGFLFWLVAARLYPDQAVGLAAAAIAAMRLLVLIATLGLDYGLIRFVPGPVLL